MTPHEFASRLADLRLENTFNPYADQCLVHDTANAPQTRRDMLLATITAASSVEIDSIWIGRDLGYRGGRRTGLALTDDVHIPDHMARWGLSVPRLTRGELVSERTAAIIWSMLSQINSEVFLWNVFPLHPHKKGKPFTNRAHNSRERAIGIDYLKLLIDILRPRRLICIGNDAASAAHSIPHINNVVRVRHPSYGGQTEFRSQVARLYGLGQRINR
jgi:hypothetical protein